MADQINNSPSSTDSKLDANESTKKRKSPSSSSAMAAITKNLQRIDHPPCKRPNKDKQPAAKEQEEEEEEDMKDTATSNPKKVIITYDQEKEKEDESNHIELPDFDVMEALIRYHSRHGFYPFVNSSILRDFISPWIRLGFGNPEELFMKIEKVKNKFKKDDRKNVIEHGNLEEFELWMKIWGKNQDDEGGCS